MIILKKVLGCLLIAGVVLLMSGTIKIVIERLSTEPFLTQLPGLVVSLVIAIACVRWAKKLIAGDSASANHKSSTPFKNFSGRVEGISSTAATLRLSNGTLTEFRDNKLQQILTEEDELSVLTGKNGQLLRVFRSKTMEMFQKDTSSMGYKIFFALVFMAFTSIPLLGSLLITSAVSWCLLLSSKDAFSEEPYAIDIGSSCLDSVVSLCFSPPVFSGRLSAPQVARTCDSVGQEQFFSLGAGSPSIFSCKN